NVSREQLATMIYRYEKFTGGGFQDAWAFLLDYVDRDSISDWAYESVCWMTVNSVMNGMPEKLFAPKETATRAQLATVLANYIELEA
ncbi:MAG: S-layer homology domain-containing protein, partial [Clostridiales bacterium]|nr:S-layer homology domain-containing protein [Clostridiales bacterium]